jgi:cell shape-determining protein MreD
MVIVIIMQPAAVAEPIKVMVVEADPAVAVVVVVNMAAVVVVILPVEIMLEAAEPDPDLVVEMVEQILVAAQVAVPMVQGLGELAGQE